MSVNARTLSEALFHLKGMALARPSSGNSAPGDWQSHKDPLNGLYTVSMRMEMFPLEIYLTRLKEPQLRFLQVAYETNVTTLFVHLASVQHARRTMEQLQRNIKQEMVQWYGKKRSHIINNTNNLEQRRAQLLKLPPEKTIIKTMPSYSNWEVARHEYNLAMRDAFPGYEGCRTWHDYHAKTLSFRAQSQRNENRPAMAAFG